MSEDILTEMFTIIKNEVLAGYLSRDDIIEVVLDSIEAGNSPDWLKNKTERITDKVLAYHQKRSSKWLHVTDNDKLDEAFAELDRQGIVARQDFTCCQNCGLHEIDVEINDTKVYRPVTGYVFFHTQDTMSAVRGNGLYLAYGAINKNDVLRVPHQIVETLVRHGLYTKWEGSIAKRIYLPDFKWQRRRNFEMEFSS